MTLERLAYEEARSALDRQSASLDSLRARAGILLAAISLATSFFGGLALRTGDLPDRVVAAAGCATALALAAGGLCVAVLWPRAAEWQFNVRARALLPELQAAEGEPGAYATLARTLDDAYGANDESLEGLYWRFRLGCVALGLEAVAWVVTLAL